MSMLRRTGQLFVISAPSGVGKTTLVRSLLRELPDLKFSVSSTTRLPRQGEIDGKDYHFVTRELFLAGIEARRFLEWAHVHGEYYGTDRQKPDSWLMTGSDVLLDIDVQGARQVRCIYPSAHNIFILPPSLGALEQRLQARGTEPPEKIAARLTAARSELQESPWYDFIVVNDVVEQALADLIAIVRALRCHRAVQAHRLRAVLDFHTPPS
jgi:guanylate kinase